MKKVTDIDVKGKKVFVRIGFDVPIEDGKILDDSRIRASLPTIEHLRDSGAAQITIGSHLGRPKGKPNDEFSLAPVAKKLAKLLGAKDYTKENLSETLNNDFDWEAFRIEPNIILLENLRFDPGEEEDSNDFAKKLAALADSPRGEAGIYVNDAFSVSHRVNASVSAITKLLPSYAGMQLVEEVEELTKLTKDVVRPFGVIIGGAKTEDKLPAVKNLSTLADFFLLGGVVANTFLAARGHNLGKSKIDKDLIPDAKKIWTQIMNDPGRDIFLPRDLIISKKMKKAKDQKVISLKDIEQIKDSDYKIVDIGPKTVELYKSKIIAAETIFWNGNLGVTEVKEFAKGSEGVAKTIAESDCYSVIGGGDTGGYIDQIGLAKKYNFISTGGGATLDFLAGKELPGLKALG